MPTINRQIKSNAIKRLGWFVLIWAASVLALGILAYGIRWLIRH